MFIVFQCWHRFLGGPDFGEWDGAADWNQRGNEQSVLNHRCQGIHPDLGSSPYNLHATVPS